MFLFDYFIDEKLRKSADAYYRARLLVGIILLVFVLLTLHLLALVLQDSISHFVMMETAIYVVPVNCFFLALLFVFKYTKKFYACVQTFLMVSFAVTMTPIYFYGGPAEAPSLPMLSVPVILAFCLGGLRIGMFWGVLIFVSLYTQFGMLLMGYEFPQLNKGEPPAELRVMNWTIAFIITVGIVVVYEVINQRLKSELKKEREHLRELATHDNLTGVANRVKFKERLYQSCRSSDKRGDSASVALLYIDLDGFKEINDNEGHSAGDLVLQTVAERLTCETKDSDTVARVGGDEFAVLIEHEGDKAGLQRLVEKIHDRIVEPIENAPSNLSLGASIGVAIYPSDTRDPEDLVNIADAAMYIAKRNQGGWQYQSTH